MSLILGIDWASDAVEEFAGDLPVATFTRVTGGSYDANNPAGTPAQTSASYSCKAIAFSYEERFVDGTLIKKGDYQVTILIGTIVDADESPSSVIPNPGDTISVPPPASETPAIAKVVSVGPLTQAAVTVQVRGIGA